MTPNTDLAEEQRRIEEDAALTGVRRATRALAKAREKEREATTQVGTAMIRRLLDPMVELYLADVAKRDAGRAVKGASLMKPLRSIAPRVLCMVAARAALNRMHRPTKLTAIARRIGEALEDELRWYHWEQLNPQQAKAVRKLVARGTTHLHTRRSLAGFARRWQENVLRDPWSTFRTVGIGLRFVDYLVSLGVMRLTQIGHKGLRARKKKPAWAVELTAEAARWAKDMADLLSTSRPLSWPLVIPPVPWTDLYGGGFHFRAGMDHPGLPRPLRALPLVRYATKEHKEMLQAADLSLVYSGLNAMQATAWHVNSRAYGVLVKLMEGGRGGPGLTPLDPRVIPERPREADQSKEAHVAWKNIARKAHTANARMASKRFAEHRTFSAAKKFCVYPSIYFAYNLDFRGRVYACCDDLSPQGTDLQRGLLEFSKGDVLDANGVKWLRIHLANTFGVDKVSFEDRVSWAKANASMIVQVAANPLDCLDWHKADKPWQFLAACFAWHDYITNPEKPCRVPVMLDGSCSGIQHYAALLRDETVGAAVNLVYGDKPGDLYANVAKEVMELLANSREPYAAEWHAFGIDRKIVKRSVMVLPYGGTFISNLDYVRQSVNDRLAACGYPSWMNDKNEREATVALGKFVWKAMRRAVRRPIEGMEYVKKFVHAFGDKQSGRAFWWNTPSGFPVVTQYGTEVAKSAARGVIGGRPITLGLNEQQIHVPDWDRVARAAPPNFVHSLDAAHLIRSLARARREGLTEFATVHDAFGTTPTKTEHFAGILRAEFAELYLYDPFDALRASVRSVNGEIPEPPASGTLNPMQIKEAPYLFA